METTQQIVSELRREDIASIAARVVPEEIMRVLAEKRISDAAMNVSADIDKIVSRVSAMLNRAVPGARA